MTLGAGSRLGPYEIAALLGAGGMGEVYRARDTKHYRVVAIKVLPAHLSNDAEALARFEREAKAVAALSHPNILGIFDLGSDGGTAYAVMELLTGETFRQRSNERPKELEPDPIGLLCGNVVLTRNGQHYVYRLRRRFERAQSRSGIAVTRIGVIEG